MQRSQRTRNLILLLAIGSSIAFLDQWSKSWAKESLGTYAHPIPIQVDSTQTIEDAVGKRFGLSIEEARLIVSAHQVSLLPEPPLKNPAQVAYPESKPEQEREIYIFGDGPEYAPRRVLLFDRFLLHKWLRTVQPNLPIEKLMAHIHEEIGTWSLDDIIEKRVRHFDAETREEAFKNGWVYGTKGMETMQLGDPLEAGRIAVVQHRSIHYPRIALVCCLYP